MALSLLPLSSAGIVTRVPSASFVALANPRSRIPSLNFTNGSTSSGTLHCSLFSSPLTTLSSSPSSIAGSSLEISLFNKGLTRQRRGSFVVRAGKAALCLTKRNKSRKSLARTHGFRRRMKTTAGRAILKRRRAKGRKVLCTQTNPNRGK